MEFLSKKGIRMLPESSPFATNVPVAATLTTTEPDATRIIYAVTPASLLDFWFRQDRKAWFEKDPGFDDAIRSRFLQPYDEAIAGRLEKWKDEPRNSLALVILLDQFPRNMFRRTARAFAADAQARDAARAILNQEWDKAFSPDARMFTYLPFEHSEALEDQELSLRLFEGSENYEWARRHWEIIRRFGRFPHRNAILGRASTLEELEFLLQPGSSF
jgi:uncharacterized protein (DUF924 family)